MDKLNNIIDPVNMSSSLRFLFPRQSFTDASSLIMLALCLHVSLYLEGIMHKWANPHFDDIEKKSRSSMKYRIKRINTN